MMAELLSISYLKIVGYALFPTLALLFMIFTGKLLINAGFYVSAAAIFIYFLVNRCTHLTKGVQIS